MGAGLVCRDKQENMSRFGPGGWSRKETKDSPKIEAVEGEETWPKLLNMVKDGSSEMEKAGLCVLKWKLRGSCYHWQKRS